MELYLPRHRWGGVCVSVGAHGLIVHLATYRGAKIAKLAAHPLVMQDIWRLEIAVKHRRSARMQVTHPSDHVGQRREQTARQMIHTGGDDIIDGAT